MDNRHFPLPIGRRWLSGQLLNLSAATSTTIAMKIAWMQQYEGINPEPIVSYQFVKLVSGCK
jgi:hypothetical protein